jgi:hypothetical protein
MTIATRLARLEARAGDDAPDGYCACGGILTTRVEAGPGGEIPDPDVPATCAVCGLAYGEAANVVVEVVCRDREQAQAVLRQTEEDRHR